MWPHISAWAVCHGIKSSWIQNKPYFVLYLNYYRITRDPSSIPGSGRCPGEGNSNPLQYSWVQFSCSVVSDSLCLTPWTAARQASLSITNSWSSPKPMSIELVMPSNHLILCHSLLLLPSIFPSIRVFSNESTLHIRWPNVGVSASTSVLPMNAQDWSSLGWTGWISLQSTGLSQFKSFNSLALSFLYSPTFTSTHDHWKKHNID